MGGRHKLVQTLAVACFFGAIATSLSAQPLPTMRVRVVDTAATTASHKPADAAQTAAGTSVTADLQITPAPEDDGLRKDPRWPQMRNCIENTTTPKEFETCLHQTLMTDSSGFDTAVAAK